MWFLSYFTEQKAQLKNGCARSVQVADFASPVVHTLTQLWKPLILQGQVKKLEHFEYFRQALFKKTMVDKVDIMDLIATATRIRRSRTACLEIGALLLESRAVSEIKAKIDLAVLFPNQIVEMKARKLIIVTPECPYEHVPEGVGTVEVILNSAYTGGEMQVECNDQVIDLPTGPYSWLVVPSHMTSSIRAVTSGARVSLICDVIGVPASGNAMPMFTKGRFDPIRAYLASEITDVAPNVAKLISIAEHLRPELIEKNQLVIDACVLNSSTLEALGNSANLSRLFPHKKVAVQAKYLVIDRSTGQPHTHTEEPIDRGEGYLGTLVMILSTTVNGSFAHLSRDGVSAACHLTAWCWHAYTADTTVTVDPVVACGTRVALHYDIYSAEPAVVTHDPLPDYAMRTESSSFLTCSIVPEPVREQTLAALETELASTGAVIITLQHMFPEGPTDQLWNTYTSYLQGGDRVLYDIITGTNTSTNRFSEHYRVQLVEVTIRCQYDHYQQKDVVASELCTFVPYADPHSKLAQGTEQGSLKVIIATRLTEKHRAYKYHNDRVYQVFSLYVTKNV